MFNKILICSDGSTYARNAALLGSEIASRFNSEVLALNVFDLAFAATGAIGTSEITLSQETIDFCMTSEQEAAERVINPIFTQCGRPYRMLQEIGYPVDCIVQVADREQADLIVVGSQGLTGLKEFFLGSVSLGVLHLAHCPVLIDRGQPTPIRRILLASDSSAGAQNAASYAFALAKQFDACLTVLNVVETPGLFDAGHPDPMKTDVGQEDSQQRGRAIKESLQALVTDTKLAYNLHQESGHPGKSIITYAASGKFDLIVLGSRGLGGVARMVLGSVSNYVAHHADCPLLVVR